LLTQAIEQIRVELPTPEDWSPTFFDSLADSIVEANTAAQKLGLQWPFEFYIGENSGYVCVNEPKPLLTPEIKLFLEAGDDYLAKRLANKLEAWQVFLKTHPITYDVDDEIGKRVLVIPLKEPDPKIDPTQEILAAEHITNVRLPDGGNPLEYLRLYTRWKEEKPGGGFRKFCEVEGVTWMTSQARESRSKDGGPDSEAKYSGAAAANRVNEIQMERGEPQTSVTTLRRRAKQLWPGTRPKRLSEKHCLTLADFMLKEPVKKVGRNAQE
jgi:hypothetical protein